jgi:hypothetical protein
VIGLVRNAVAQPGAVGIDTAKDNANIIAANKGFKLVVHCLAGGATLIERSGYLFVIELDLLNIGVLDNLSGDPLIAGGLGSGFLGVFLGGFLSGFLGGLFGVFLGGFLGGFLGRLLSVFLGGFLGVFFGGLFGGFLSGIRGHFGGCFGSCGSFDSGFGGGSRGVVGVCGFVFASCGGDKDCCAEREDAEFLHR